MQEVSYEIEEYEMEIENRIRNLMWTVSGDYALNTRLDVASFSKSKYISMYDAIKQGAFAKYFDTNALSMYIVKKLFYGVEEPVLMNIAQICVDLAVYQKIVEERPGVCNIRRKAFEAMLDKDFRKMNDSFIGRVKLELVRQFLNGRELLKKEFRMCWMYSILWKRHPIPWRLFGQLTESIILLLTVLLNENMEIWNLC